MCFLGLLAASGAQGATSSSACSTARLYHLTSATQAYYAVAKHGLRAFDRPDGGVISTFGRLNVNRVPTVFGVLGAHVRGNCRPVWFRVQLPMRPNGATGYVKASSVTAG